MTVLQYWYYQPFMLEIIAYYMLIALRLPVPVIAHLKL